jgi:hypothetical protein
LLRLRCFGSSTCLCDTARALMMDSRFNAFASADPTAFSNNSHWTKPATNA